MDISILSVLLDTPMVKPKQLEIPFPKEKKPAVKLPVGSKISYPWYKETIFGKVIGDYELFPSFQLAELGVQGVKAIVIIDPNKAMLL